MEKAKATPTPWRVVARNQWVWIASGDYMIAKMCLGPGAAADEDGALIVAAVNARAELIEALRDMLDGRAGCRDRARRALARAKGGQ